eukprot:COSAG02_NODE_1327_length_13220_cov_11.602241_5_plen_140_part_00
MPHSSEYERETACKLYRQGVSPEEIAAVFLFGKFTARTVRRWMQEYRDSGIMVPSNRRLWVLRRHYSAFALQRMETLLAQNNGLKAKEVRLKVFQQTGEAASLRTVNRMIKLIDWRRREDALLAYLFAILPLGTALLSC